MKRWFLMALMSLFSLMAACECQESKEAFRAENEMRQTLLNFLDKEVPAKTPQVEPRERALLEIVSLVVSDSKILLAERVEKALKERTLSADEVLEAIYQCAPYVGLSKSVEAFDVAQNSLKKLHISVKQASRKTVTLDANDRFTKGVDAQIALFGESFEKIKQAGKDAAATSSYFLATNCFGDYYTREGLDLRTRELLTFAILVNHGTEPQMKAHAAANLRQGRSKEYLEQVVYSCLPFCGYPRMLNALNVLNSLEEPSALGLESIANAEKIFPRGESNPFGKYFNGQTYLQRLLEGEVPVANVTFEPGVINNWHIHRGEGQLLIVTAGNGWVQFEGEKAVPLKAGDVFYIPQDVKHWHGAAKNSWFTHLSVEVPNKTAKSQSTDWLEPVNQDDYKKL